MSEVWVIVALVAALVVAAIVVSRRMRSSRAAGVRAVAAAEYGRNRDFVQEREDARRAGLGAESRAWEDDGNRRTNAG